MKAFMAVLLLSSFAIAQSVDDLVEVLDGSSWESDYQRDESGQQQSPKNNKPLELKGKRSYQNLNCNNPDDQTSIPYKFLLSLLANKSLDIRHKEHEGILEIDGGVMIGNCQDMLEPFVSKPESSSPFYTFQMSVRKPSSCNGDKCSYDVKTVENGRNKTITKNFAPNFYGFVECLKETGVMSGKNIDKSKVTPVQLFHREVDVTETSELVYANRGFKGTQYSGKFSENKLPEFQGCYYFEDIQSGGFKTYSVDDIENFDMENLYQKVCNSGNYKLINSHIADFEDNDAFQTSLREIRNELILKEVKALHDIVNDSESLEEVDVPKFKEVTSDFLEYVINPIKMDLTQMQRLYANPGHSQKEDILKSIFGPKKAQALLGKDTRELKSILKDEMDELASKLVSYARKPYLTKDDFKKMTDSDAGAPLDDKTWTGAVLDLYEAQLTAFNYGRYSKDFFDSHYKGNPEYKNAKQYAKAADLDKKIKAKLDTTREKINRVYHVASNPDVDYSRKYEKTKNIILSEIDEKIANLEKNMKEAQWKVQTMCAVEKRQKYWINQQSCVEEARMKLMACSRQIQALLRERSGIVEKYDDMIADWDEAHGKVASRKRSSSSGSGSNSFTFTPTTPIKAQSQQMINNDYSMQLEMMRNQMYMQQLQQNNGFFNAQARLQFPSIQFGYGNQSSLYGRYPSYYNNYTNAGYQNTTNLLQPNYVYSNGGVVSSPMDFYTQQQTMAGGQFSFNTNFGASTSFLNGSSNFISAPVNGAQSGGAFNF